MRPSPKFPTRRSLLNSPKSSGDNARPHGELSGPFDATKAVRATAQALLGFGGIGLGTLSSKGAKTDTPVLDCTVAAAPQLPVTGDPVRPIVFSGLAFIVFGAGLLMLLRRRRSAQV